MKIVLLIAACLVFSIQHTYAQDGTPNLFGKDSIGLPSHAKAIALQANGMIIEVGNVSDNSIGLIRFNPVTGSPDPAFGVGGKVKIKKDSVWEANAVALQSDGKIIVAGTSYRFDSVYVGFWSYFLYPRFLVVRYLSDGTLDTTFNHSGYVTTAAPSLDPFAGPGATEPLVGSSMAIQTNGKIVVAGNVSNGTGKVALARYNTNGSLDAAFGIAGIAQAEVSYPCDLTAIAFQSDNKLVAIGTSNYGPLIVRCKSNGSLDSTFGTNGLITTLPGTATSNELSDIAVDASSRIVVAGTTYESIPYTISRWSLWRFATDGSLDTTFDHDGIASMPWSSSDARLFSVAIQLDGKIVGGGNVYKDNGVGGAWDFAVTRHKANGSLDSTFGTAGMAFLASSNDGVGYEGRSVAIQAGGQIVLGGEYNDAESNSAFLVAGWSGSSSPLAIQLSTFTGFALAGSGSTVRLEWATVSETENYGYYVERKSAGEANFITVSSLIPGAGTTLEEQHYSFDDATAAAGQSYVYRLRIVDLKGDVTFSQDITIRVVLGVETEHNLPTQYALSQSYPNPFNPSTAIQYALPASGYVTLKVYDMLGRVVATLVDGQQEAGYRSVEWTAGNFNSGVYFYRLSAGTFTDVKRMVLLR